MGRVALYDGVVDSYAVGQISDTDYQTNIQHAVNRFSGGLDPEIIAIINGDPTFSVTTQDLYTLIGAVSPTAGLAVPSGTITLPFRSRSAGGTFISGSSHYTMSATSGLLVPTEFAGDQDADDGATGKLEFYPASSNGLINPVSINQSQALASQAFVAAYDMGPFKLNSTMFTQLKSARCMFGIECQKKRYNGETWARLAGITINIRNPRFEITFDSAEDLYAFDHFSALSTTCTQFFRKRADGSTHVADNQSEHVACILTGGTQILQGGSGANQDDVAFTRTIIGKVMSFSRTSTVA